MDQEEMTRLLSQLVKRPWVKIAHSFVAGEITVQTTDRKIWVITSPLAYARLLYLYEA